MCLFVMVCTQSLKLDSLVVAQHLIQSCCVRDVTVLAVQDAKYAKLRWGTNMYMLAVSLCAC